MPDFHEATFLNSAADTASKLYVTITEFGDQAFGDPDGVVWTPSGGALPQAGDRALVAESDDGSWWAVSWWSSTQAVDTGPEALHSIGAAGEPAFTNGWANHPAGATAGFYVDRERVFLSGLIRSGAVGSAAFTLPSGYRPAASAYFSTDSNGLHARVVVDTSGGVTPDIGSNASVSLEGIEFRRA